MPTPTKGPRLGGGPAHERLILANLAQALFEHDRITTTEAKAKRLRPLAEKLITFAKRGDLHARRQVMTVIRDKDVVHKLFAEIGPKMAERPGGYTRIVKTNPRKGDNAPMAIIEIVEELELTVRSYNCLKREGIHTVGELVGRSEADLLDIRNFGSKSIDEVKIKLAGLGLALKDSPPGFSVDSYGDDDYETDGGDDFAETEQL